MATRKLSLRMHQAQPRMQMLRVCLRHASVTSALLQFNLQGRKLRCSPCEPRLRQLLSTSFSMLAGSCSTRTHFRISQHRSNPPLFLRFENTEQSCFIQTHGCIVPHVLFFHDHECVIEAHLMMMPDSKSCPPHSSFSSTSSSATSRDCLASAKHCALLWYTKEKKETQSARCGHDLSRRCAPASSQMLNACPFDPNHRKIASAAISDSAAKHANNFSVFKRWST